MRRKCLQSCCVTILLSGAAPGVADAADFESRIVSLEDPATSQDPAVPHGTTARALVSVLPHAETGAQPAVSYDLRVARGYQANAVTALKQNLRARGTGMTDAYAHGDHGLRVSVGSSYHMRYRASDAGPGAAAGRAALMRLPVGAVNLRDGYESYAPVAMLGYDAAVSERMKIGVEGGMMVGRSTAMYADETLPGMRDDSHSARNPVADLVMTYAF
ncbi:hypothetical protein [Sphingomonas sp. UYP23]